MESKASSNLSKRTNRVFKLVFVSLFVDLLAFTLILPILPKILDYYASNDKSGTYKLFNENVQVLQKLMGVPESHNKVLLAGILGSWFSFLQFLSSPFLGALSDKVGRKIILLAAMSGSVVSYTVWFMAIENFGLFVISRTIGGLCKANVSLSLAIISDVSDEKSRGKGMAIAGSSFSLAFIFGPLLGAYLSTVASGDQIQNELITNPSLIAILLSLIDLILVMMFLEETSVMKTSALSHVDKFNKKSQDLVKHRSVLTKAFHYINPKSLFNFKLVQEKSREQMKILNSSSFVYFYYLLFYSGLEFTLSFLTHVRFGFSSMDQGKLYLFSGILMAAIQGGYIRRIKGGKEPLLALIGLFLIVPSFVIMGLSTSVIHIYCSLLLYSVSSAVVVPCLTTIVSNQSPSEYKGVTMGTFRSIGSLARALGPFLASMMFWSVGPSLCYIGGAIVLILPLFLMRNLYSYLQKLSKLSNGNFNDQEKKLLTSKTLAKAS